MKKVSLTVLGILMAFSISAYSQSNLQSGRLGLIGDGVFLVKQTESSVNKSEIQVGDVITQISLSNGQTDASETCEEFNNIESVQQKITDSLVGTNFELQYLRPNFSTGGFDSRTANIKTVSHPSSQKRSTLGLVLQMGYMVKEIDARTPQPNVEVNDILLYTKQFGQIEDLTVFLSSVKRSSVNSTIEAELHRINFKSKKSEVINASLKIFPYPTAISQTQSQNKSPLVNVALVKGATSNNCSKNPCVWCCAECVPLPWSGDCGTSNCETNRSNCQQRTSGRCLMAVCV